MKTRRVRGGSSILVALITGLLVATYSATVPDIELTGREPSKRGPLIVANGFPGGRFALRNEDARLCLTSETARYYEYDSTRQQPEYTRPGNESGALGDPGPAMRACDRSVQQQWLFDSSGANTHSGVRNNLVSIVPQDTRGYFALSYGSTPSRGGMDARLVTSGSSLAVKWQFAGGYLFEEGYPKSVLTYLPGDQTLKMTPRGGPYQRWRLQAVP
ncbi:hypothetical protein [Nocardia sp. NPDC003963]